MINQFIQSGLTKVLVFTVITAQLVACGGGSSGSGGGSSDSVASTASPVEIAGSIGDGPVTGATVTIYSKSGQQIGTIISDNTASFKSTFKVKGRDYPLLLEVTGGFDLVTGSAPDFQMYSVMMKPRDKQVNINPFSTLCVKVAQSMPGGLNADNLSTAKIFVTDKLGFGLDPNVIDDLITTRITDSNVANIVKASEAMGEMVRRTRDLMSPFGTVISGDDVIDAIAADMTDGFLDGVGATGTDPAVAAVANVVSGQILVEALSNNLKVGGVIATGAIDDAIAATRTSIASTQMTGSVRITQGMLKQAQVALAAVKVLDSSSQVTDIATSVSGIMADTLPDDIVADLPADSSTSLDYAVALSAAPSAEDTAAINEIVRNSGESGITDPANTAPVISGSPTDSVVAGNNYSFRPTATDTDSDPLAFSITGKPDWASFNGITGHLSGTPADSAAGTYSNIVISVTDGMDTVSLPAFSIQVVAAIPDIPANTAPVISGSPAGSVVTGNNYSFRPTATDADEDPLAFSITNKPGWASFNGTTGRLSGTPADSAAGTYSNIVIAVTDGADTVSLPAFSIQVVAAIPDIPANTAPVISGSPAGSVVAGNNYSFQPTATDADEDPLAFSITNKPGWASFNGTTGRLSGTPADSAAGTYGSIVIAVTDGVDTASLPAFSIKVDAANTPPVINGSPAGSVVVGNNYSFQPTATDADEDPLAFSITNKPGWASFSGTTGRLSGTPADSDVRTYGSIVIAVTDGVDTVSLPAFSIQVDAAPVLTGSVTLGWTAPATRADGTPLSLAEIDGFRIYYGESAGNYNNSVEVADGTAQSVTINDIPVGTYDVVITAFDVNGSESGYSSGISMTVQ